MKRHPWAVPETAEITALGIARNLDIPPKSWGELVLQAQATISAFQQAELSSIHQVYSHRVSAPLEASARILDSASWFNQETNPELSDSQALHAAVAFSMYGNFVTADAVLKRITSTNNLPITLKEFQAIRACIAPRSINTLLTTVEDQELFDLIVSINGLLEKPNDESYDRVMKLFIPIIISASSTFAASVLRSCRTSLKHQQILSIRNLHRWPTLPTDYLNNLAKRSIRTLMPPQYLAIEDSNLLQNQANTTISLPTSTGKTLIAELISISALSDSPGIACILVPYIALGEQIHRVFREHLPDRYSVHKLVGGYKAVEPLRPEINQEIVIATPERMDSLLRLQPSIKRYIRSVVVDEAHLIEQDTRGIRLEGLLTRMRMSNEMQDTRLVLMSAALEGSSKIAEWIDAPEGNRINDRWKPTARRTAIWHESGLLTWYQHSDAGDHRSLARAKIGSIRIPWLDQDVYASDQFGGVKRQNQAATTNIAYLAQVLYEKYKGAIYIACGTKQSSRKMARALMDRFRPLDEPSKRINDIIRLIGVRFPFLSPMIPMLERGIAFHNASVPHEVRHELELAIKVGDIFVVASTTTLAEGVDLPFRFTIIAEWHFYRGEDDSKKARYEPMSPHIFRNISGRCGRAGVFSEGDTIVYENLAGNKGLGRLDFLRQLEASVFLADELPEIKSALTRLESGRDNEASLSTLSAQILASIPENLGDEDLAESFSNCSFWGTSPSKKETAKALADSIISNLLDTNGGALAVKNSPLRLTRLGEAALKTGFSPDSCRKIQFFLTDKADMLHAITPSDLCVLLSRSLGNLPEETSNRLNKAVESKKKYPIKNEDLKVVFAGWISGIPNEDVFAKLPYTEASRKSPSIDIWHQGVQSSTSWDEDYDAFEEFLAATRSYLPWLMFACEFLTGSVDDSTYADIPWSTHAELVEYGVSSLWAVHALKAGAPGGRLLISTLGENWPVAFRQSTDGAFLSSLQEADEVQASYAIDALYELQGNHKRVSVQEIESLRNWLSTKAGKDF